MTFSEKAQTPMPPMKIGVMGGMFDPIHNGHLAVALSALESIPLDHVRLVPCHVPNHRDHANASAQSRLTMLQLVATQYPGLVVDNRECKRDTVSYTVDTLISLQEQFAEATLVLILGWDSFCSLPTWHRWKDLLGLAHIVVMRRGGDNSIVSPALLSELQRREAPELASLNETRSGRIVLLSSVCETVSSTQVRDRIKAGQSVNTQVPEVVQEYIEQNELYGKSASDC